MSKKENLKEAIEKSIEQTKKIVSLPIEIVGVSQEQAHHINELFELIDKHTLSKLNADLNYLKGQKEQIEKPLNLYKRATLQLKGKEKTNIYKDLIKEIETLEENIKPINENIERYEKFIDFTNKQIEEMKTHIDITTNKDETKSIWTYDINYFKPMLDLAILMLPLTNYNPPKEDE